MGKPPRRLGKEFEAEAVRLVEMSGRTQREIAEDLGIGLSTLRRWLDKRRERDLEAPPPERQEDLAAELKRLRPENGISAAGTRDPEEGRDFFREGGKSMGSVANF
jgi:transposase